jgi:hypothetical protein
MKLIFIDLASLRKESFIPWLVTLDKRFQGCTIPNVNVTNTHSQKQVVIQAFDNLRKDNKYIDYKVKDNYDFNVRTKIDSWYYLWNMIKKSKYYKKI